MFGCKKPNAVKPQLLRFLMSDVIKSDRRANVSMKRYCLLDKLLCNYFVDDTFDHFECKSTGDVSDENVRFG